MSKDINESVLDTIQSLIQSSIKSAGYDKTIQAQILSCEDETIGKYRCRYQDAVFYAYSNSEATFLNGSYVYILIPENDMRKEKTILGSTDQLGVNYISQIKGEQIYDIIGANCVTSDRTYYLDINNKNYLYSIYNYDRQDSEVTINVEALEKYIKQSSSLIVAATFQTNIAKDRQSRGHYGIAFNLTFNDNATGEETTRTYIINEDNMIDNPYKLIQPVRQYQIFNIDGQNFVRLDSIQIFNKDFPFADGDVETGLLEEGMADKDNNNRPAENVIAINKLEIYGANIMLEQQINGVGISFYTPDGTFFTPDSISSDYKRITAQVRIKGKQLVSQNEQDIKFYWGSENASISANSEYYNKYLGRGWKCLNESNVIRDDLEESDPIVEWVPGTSTYILNYSDAKAKNNKFKVAVLYNDTVITKEINIQNLSIEAAVLTIESSDGDIFYYDQGHPTLTCKVNGEEILNYKYYWVYESNTGMLEQLPESQNIEQTDAQIVNKNKIYNVQIRNITNFGIFKCAVCTNNDIYLGTASIKLVNSLKTEGSYSLVINNGSVVFQYNENGVAPNSQSLDIPQTIQALSFTVYDNLGNSINDEIFKNANDCSVRWQIPIENTLLVDKNQDIEDVESETDAENGYIYYDNLINLLYDIKPFYNINSQRNQIKLTVKYKEISLTAETNFTFTKQGDPGTNGTEFLVKLIPNVRADAKIPYYPMITRVKTISGKYLLNYKLAGTIDNPSDDIREDETLINEGTEYKLFKAQLWYRGELVWEGTSNEDPAFDHTTSPSYVEWTVLKNKYSSSSSDISLFTIEDALTGDISFSMKNSLNNFVDITTALADIIKCSIRWEGKDYYATMPIVVAQVENNNYRIGLKDYSGFRYVTYTADGINPQYSNVNSFEFICMERINDIWEDVSQLSRIYYSPSSCGTVNGLNANLLTLLNNEYYRENKKHNQWDYRPASRYNGECVNEAVTCIYTRQTAQGSSIGKINIPIHFLLNKYGFAHLNAWDGNSIQINNDGGYILAPQMGAGIKENDNSFTGILMGEIKFSGYSNIGLFGFNSGERTFFLNSQNGSALLGKSNSGQIVIDPNNNNTLLYSSNFWKNYNSNGLPTSYIYRNAQYQKAGNGNGQGLLIDLSKPQIYFGNGKFYITSNGLLHATDAEIQGDIIATNGFIVKQNNKQVSQLGFKVEEEGYRRREINYLYFGDTYQDSLTISTDKLIYNDGDIGRASNIRADGIDSSLTITNYNSRSNGDYTRINFTPDGVMDITAVHFNSSYSLDPRIYLNSRNSYIDISAGNSVALHGKKSASITGDNISMKGDQISLDAYQRIIFDAYQRITFTTNSSATSSSITFFKNNSNDIVFRPMKNDEIFLGTSAFRWKTIYSVNPLSVVSDRNKKYNIQDLSEKYEQLFDHIKPKSYMLLNGNRKHIGAISQDIEEAMKDIGMTPLEFGGFCKDAVIDEQTNNPIYDKNGKQKYEYSLRYSEFIMLNTWQIQKLKSRIKELENIIKTLTNK